MTNKINNGGAAFPRPLGSSPTTGAYRSTEQTGMTYRQWLAGMALQGLASGEWPQPNDHSPEIAAREAVRYADALIAELEKDL